jgi:hypothetical protein
MCLEGSIYLCGSDYIGHKFLKILLGKMGLK